MNRRMPTGTYGGVGAGAGDRPGYLISTGWYETKGAVGSVDGVPACGCDRHAAATWSDWYTSFPVEPDSTQGGASRTARVGLLLGPRGHQTIWTTSDDRALMIPGFRSGGARQAR